MAKAARLNLAEGWKAVAAGQTEPLSAAKGRASSELRHSPTRPEGGAAPKKEKPSPETGEGFFI